MIVKLESFLCFIFELLFFNIQDCIDSSFASSKGQMASFAYPKLSDSSSNTLRKIYDSKVMKVGITVYNSFIDIMTKGMEKVAYKYFFFVKEMLIIHLLYHHLRIGEFYLGGAIGLPVKAEYYYYSDEYVMINDLLSGKLDSLIVSELLFFVISQQYSPQQ